VYQPAIERAGRGGPVPVSVSGAPDTGRRRRRVVAGLDHGAGAPHATCAATANTELKTTALFGPEAATRGSFMIFEGMETITEHAIRYLAFR
jgi:hypothetical protein